MTGDDGGPLVDRREDGAHDQAHADPASDDEPVAGLAREGAASSRMSLLVPPDPVVTGDDPTTAPPPAGARAVATGRQPSYADGSLASDS